MRRQYTRMLKDGTLGWGTGGEWWWPLLMAGGGLAVGLVRLTPGSPEEVHGLFVEASRDRRGDDDDDDGDDDGDGARRGRRVSRTLCGRQGLILPASAQRSLSSSSSPRAVGGDDHPTPRAPVLRPPIFSREPSFSVGRGARPLRGTGGRAERAACVGPLDRVRRVGWARGGNGLRRRRARHTPRPPGRRDRERGRRGARKDRKDLTF